MANVHFDFSHIQFIHYIVEMLIISQTSSTDVISGTHFWKEKKKEEIIFLKLTFEPSCIPQIFC